MNLKDCLLKLKATGKTVEDKQDLLIYSKDQSYHEPMAPLIIFECTTEQDIVTCLQICNQYKVPVVPISGHTSLEGHTIPITPSVAIDTTGLVDFHINAQDLDCVVGPGIGWSELKLELESVGLFYPPDAGAAAMFGGMCGTNCSGTLAWRYGQMKDNVISLRVVLADGTVIKTRRRPRKSSAGYDLTRLFIGSEGTLGIISEITLKLQVIPSVTYVVMAQFNDLNDAGKTVLQVVQSGLLLQRMELMDEFTISAVNIAHKLDPPFPENITILFECAGHDDITVKKQYEDLESICQKNSCTYFKKEPGSATNKLWHIRKAALFASKVLANCKNPQVMITDAAVPISHLGEMLIETRKDLNQHEIPSCLVAHAGDGNIHAFVLVDPENPMEIQRAEQFRARNSRLALKLDGTCTGEHGIGLGKRELLVEEVGPTSVELMRKIKKTLDPNGILNPGKVFELKTAKL